MFVINDWQDSLNLKNILYKKELKYVRVNLWREQIASDKSNNILN